MSLWEISPSNKSCLVSSSTTYSYSEVYLKIKKLSKLISNGSPKKRLVALLVDNSPESIIKYLTCLNLKYSVILIDKKLNVDLLNHPLDTYKQTLFCIIR